MRPRAELLALALAAMASLAAASAPAQTRTAARPIADARVRGPIKITAERAELDRREYALYRGNVKLVAEDMVLTGERLELRQPDPGQFEVRLTGAPARLDHPGDTQGPPVSASATEIVYDTRTATVDLTGSVQLARGADQLSGDQVRYFLAARRISANGSDVGQIQLTITPPPKAAQDAPDPSAPKATPPKKRRKKK